MSERKSPKQSATLFEVGNKKKGLDGGMWIIKQTKNGVKRWVRNRVDDTPNDQESRLEKHLNKWWQRLAGGSFLVIDNTGKYRFFTSRRVTNKAKVVDIQQKWLEHSENDAVVAIIWSSQSRDGLTHLIARLIKKIPKKTLERLITEKTLIPYIIANYKRICTKYRMYSDKDWLL